MRHFAILLIIIGLASCIQELPIEVPGNQNQLVVGSLINPQKLISLNASYVNPFQDTLAGRVPKILEILIKENDVVIDTPMGQGPDIYSSTYPMEGSKYELYVRTENEVVTASTMIPKKVNLIRTEYSVKDIPSQTVDKIMEYLITWEDPPLVENFYELQLLDQEKRPFSYYSYQEIDDQVLVQEGDLSYMPDSFVFRDEQFEGHIVTIKISTSHGSIRKTPTVYALLRSVSKEYYHFKKSWHRHVFLQNADVVEDGNLDLYDVYSLLFQGDPIPLYSNIKEGRGIFAGFTEDVRKFTLKK